MHRCHDIGQLIKSHFPVNALVLVVQLHINHNRGHYSAVMYTISVLKCNVSIMCIKVYHMNVPTVPEKVHLFRYHSQMRRGVLQYEGKKFSDFRCL